MTDNASFGSWDFDAIANEWDAELVEEWGVDVWQDVMAEDEDVSEGKEHDDLSGKVNPIFQIVIDCEGEGEQEKIFNELKDTYKCRVLTL